MNIVLYTCEVHISVLSDIFPFSGLAQQCCYDNEGSLKPGIGQPNIGTPLYEDMNELVTHLKETVLMKIYCCKEGLSKCDELEEALSPDDGGSYTAPIPGNLAFLST